MQLAVQASLAAAHGRHDTGCRGHLRHSDTRWDLGSTEIVQRHEILEACDTRRDELEPMRDIDASALFQRFGLSGKSPWLASTPCKRGCIPCNDSPSANSTKGAIRRFSFST